MNDSSLTTGKNDQEQHITLKTIAARAGVHKSTVSLALRDNPRIPKETCQRIQQLANEMGYRPNPYVKAVMSHMRAGKKPSFQGTLGFLHTCSSPGVRNGYITKVYVKGARTRAEERGFKLIEFDLQSNDMTPSQLKRMLLARNIHTLVVYHHPTPGIPGHEIPMDLSPFSVVCICSRLENPSYTYVSTDAFYASSLAVTKAIEKGYRRIGLAISGYTDYENDYRYSGGFSSTLERYGICNSVPVCFIESDDMRELKPWIQQHKPDIVLGMNDEVPQAVQELGYRIPDDMGWIHLDWVPGLNNWSAIDGMHEAVGKAAVDIVVAQFNRNERGPPIITRSSLIAGGWIDGETVSRQSPVFKLQPRYKPLAYNPEKKPVTDQVAS